MATARMTMAVAGTKLSVITARSETNLSRNGAVLSMAAPVAGASISCKFVGFGVVKRTGFGAIAARAADLEQESLGFGGDVATEEEFSGPPAESFTPRADPQQGSKLYVGNLPWTYDSQQLAEVFQDVASVELVEVIYDQETGRSRGFAFVTMTTHEDALEAIAKLDGSDLGGRALRVNFPQSNRDKPRFQRSERPMGGDRRGGPGSSNPNKLFVGNLSWGVDDQALNQLFSDYGKVVDAKVVYDRDSGRSRGFGFVTYGDASEVNTAIENLDGADFDGRQLRVNLAGDKPPPRQY